MAATPSLPGLLNPQGLSVGRGARCVLEAPFPSCSKSMQTGRPGGESALLAGGRSELHALWAWCLPPSHKESSSKWRDF